MDRQGCEALTFHALEKTLPNGLHDAELLGVEIDYANNTAALDLLVDFSIPPQGNDATPPAEQARLGCLLFSGVQFVVIDPPGVGADGFAPSRIDAGSGVPIGPAVPLPVVQSPGFLVWIFVDRLNAFIRIAASDVSIGWRHDVE